MKGSTTIEEIKLLIDSSGGVIFDNDGTVVDTMPAHYLAYVAALDPHGIKFPRELFYGLAGMPAGTIVDKLKSEQGKSDVCTAKILEARSNALGKTLQHVKGIKPVLELLRYAKSKGKKVAIASGSESKEVKKSLEAAGLDWKSDFDAFVTREDVTNGKPDPETFIVAARRMGLDLSDCVGLEDGELGIQALETGGAAGIVDVRYLDGYPRVPEMN